MLVTGDNGPWEVRDCAPILLTGAAGAAGSGDEAADFSISSSLQCWSDSCCSAPLAPANLAVVNCVFDCVKVKCNLTGSKGPYLGTWQQENGGGSSAKTTLWEAGHRSETTTHTAHTLCRLHVCLAAGLATWLPGPGWLAGWLAAVCCHIIAMLTYRAVDNRCVSLCAQTAVGLASWPGVIAKGAVSGAITSSLDYFPTVAALSGTHACRHHLA